MVFDIMAEWLNKGNFSRGSAYTQCLRRDFVTGFGAHIRVRNVSVAILSWIFLRGSAHTQCLRTRRDTHVHGV